MANPRRLVLGLGNPLVGEDGFGPAVIETLRRRPDLPDGADLVDAGTDLLGQLDTLESYDEVVLVDVVISDGRAGTIEVIEEATLTGWPDTSPSCHHVSPLLAVKLFRTLHPQASTRIKLVALHAEALHATPGVAPTAVAAGAQLVAGLIR